MIIQPVLFKWTVVANIKTDDAETGDKILLHRELDFLTEKEADEWIDKNSEYEKIPVYQG